MLIYHYTDFHALYGIISKGELWMFSTIGMNDPEEMTSYRDYLKERIKDEREGELEKFRVEEWFEEHDRILNQPAYVMSFSHLRDDVAQWGRYGNNGCGVNIVFEYAALQKLAGLQINGMLLSDVVYDGSINEFKLVEQMQTYLDTQSLPYAYDTDDSLFRDVVGNACMYKDEHYEIEKECRLALPAPLSSKDYAYVKMMS